MCPLILLVVPSLPFMPFLGSLSQVPPTFASCFTLRRGADCLFLLRRTRLELRCGLLETCFDDSQGVRQERTRRSITTHLYGTWESVATKHVKRRPSGQLLGPNTWPEHAPRKAPKHMKRVASEKPFPRRRRSWHTDQYRGDVVPRKRETRGTSR